MSEIQTTTTNTQTVPVDMTTNGGGTAVPAAEPKNTDTPGPIPYDRFKEINDRNKELEKQLQALHDQVQERKTADEIARKQALKDQEQFKELADEYEEKVAKLEPQVKDLTAQVKKLTKMLEDQAAAQMARVPDLYRSALEKLPVMERLEWLTENADKLVQDKPAGVPPTPKGQGRGEISPEERRRRSPRTF